jgi:hypothetical protein
MATQIQNPARNPSGDDGDVREEADGAWTSGRIGFDRESSIYELWISFYNLSN